MSSLTTALVTYEEFSKLPDPTDAKRYELHDGEVVLVPPARPIHLVLQMRILKLLRFAEEFGCEVVMEFPYKPALQYQFWYADVAIVSSAIQVEMAEWTDYKPYAPVLVVEVKSPSNTRETVAKQRIASMSNGTREFWFVDSESKTIHVTTEHDARTYAPGESIDVLNHGRSVCVEDIFAGIGD